MGLFIGCRCDWTKPHLCSFCAEPDLPDPELQPEPRPPTKREQRRLRAERELLKKLLKI